MPIWPQFIGGTYLALSPTIGADQAINIYAETREVPGSAKMLTFYGTPGLKPYASVSVNGTTGNRGWFTQDGRTWTVVGDTLFEIDTVNVTATDRGTIPDDGLPVFFASNGLAGDQLAIAGGGAITVLDLTTNVLSTASLPFPDPVTLVFMDGYGITNQKDTNIFWYSALEDFTDWDGLDFIGRSGTSDNLMGLAVTLNRLWTLGSLTTTQFYNSGDADVPFLPYPGTTMQTGLVSPYLMSLYNDVLYWVGVSTDGSRRVVNSNVASSAAANLSTPPIARFLERCTSMDGAEMFCYEQQGHPFVALTCPESPDDVQTYVFDIKEELWHARAGWDEMTGRYTRWRASGCTSTGGQVFVGDFETGDLYTLDLDTYEDNGVLIRRERTAPYVSSDNQVIFVDQFQLGTEAGVGLSSGQGIDPQVTLEISRDGAKTWVNAGSRGLGRQGEYGYRTKWTNLGRFVAALMVFRVTQTDPVKTVWGPGAWIRATPGTGQL